MAMIVYEPIEIREARERLGLTLKELAKELGVTESALSRWETGERQPRLEMMRKIVDEIQRRQSNGRRKQKS